MSGHEATIGLTGRVIKHTQVCSDRIKNQAAHDPDACKCAIKKKQIECLITIAFPIECTAAIKFVSLTDLRRPVLRFVKGK